MEDLEIVCPSKGRYEDVKTLKLLPEAKLIVPQNEVELYKSRNKEAVVIGTPEYVRGIVATRQWILENFENVFMVDDDVEYVRRNFTTKPSYLEPGEIISAINSTAEIAEGIGAKVFGYRSIRNPQEYNEFKIFETNGYMNASYCGFLKGHGMSYDLTMDEAEDYYVSCLCVYKNRYCLIDHRYSFITSGNFTSAGGCSTYRTAESLRKNAIYLRRKFGSVITKKKANKNKLNVYEGEKTLKFPF